MILVQKEFCPVRTLQLYTTPIKNLQAIECLGIFTQADPEIWFKFRDNEIIL